MQQLTPREIRDMCAGVAANEGVAPDMKWFVKNLGLSVIHDLIPGKIYAMAGNMLTMDVFAGDAFAAVNLTAAIDKEGYVPQLLGSIADLFIPPPLGQPRSSVIFVEERDNEPAIIHTSPRGSFPDPERTDEKTRDARPFKTRRLYKSRRITANEIARIRQFGSITEVQQLQTMVARFQYLMQRDMSLTWEFHRLGAVQGKVVDSDGSTLDSWDTLFGQTIPAEVTWSFPSTADGTVRAQATKTKRDVVRALKGLGGQGVRVHALASDSWWDAFIASAEVRTTYQAQEALRMQEDVTWKSFDYGGITFWNYRGTDDNSTVAVPDKKVKFFASGAGIFQNVFSPADERFEFIDTPGQEMYSWIVLDPLRNAWADVECVSYPLFMCTMPSALQRGKIT